MLRNSISYIFRLGKKSQPLPFQPLRQLSAIAEHTSLLPPNMLAMQKVPAKSDQAPHSNQMSS